LRHSWPGIHKPGLRHFDPTRTLFFDAGVVRWSDFSVGVRFAVGQNYELRIGDRATNSPADQPADR
jgi:hypothetical protein